MVNSLFSRNLTFYKTLAEDTTNKNGIGVYIRDTETNKYVCHHTTDYNTILSDDFNQKVGESAQRGQIYTALETISSYSERIKELGLFYIWNAGVNYSKYAVVFKNNAYWRSLQDNNINHDPEEPNSEWWEKFQLENFPHIIYSNYTVKPYYEVLSNGMCKQWSIADPSVIGSSYTENTTFSFAIPYKNTGYLLYPVGFDVRDVGSQRVTLSTTGFTTSSLSTPCGTRCWVAYGEVDLSQISDYIL